MANELDQLNLTQAGTLPPELYAQQQALNRQQQLASMLMQQNTQPQGQMISGRYVAPAWTQMLQPVANMLTGAYLAKQGDTKAADLAKQLREGKNIAEEKIIQAMTPQEAKITELAGPAYKGQAPVAYEPPKEPNWSEAARLIRTNEFGAGKDLLPQVLKNFAPEMPHSVLEYKFAEKNPEYMGYRTALNKAGAPSMTAITNVANYEPFKNKIQGGMGEGLVKQWETLKNIPVEINNINKAIELAPQGFVGTFAQQKTDIAKLFNNNLGTKIAVDKINNTEELGSRLFVSTMENLKKMDATPSQYQQKVMQDAFGTITSDPTSLPKILAVQKEILEAKAASHNLQVKQAETGPAKMEFPYSIYIGEQPTSTGNQGGWRVK
jgi:hypothetical protein